VGSSSPFKRKNYFKMEINKKEMGPNNNKNDQLIKVGKKILDQNGMDISLKIK
jgi:hypothetical protein